VLGINGTENPRNDAVAKPRNEESMNWGMTRRSCGCKNRKITSVPALADKTASAVSSRTYKSIAFLRQLSVPLIPNTQLQVWKWACGAAHVWSTSGHGHAMAYRSPRRLTRSPVSSATPSPPVPAAHRSGFAFPTTAAAPAAVRRLAITLFSLRRISSSSSGRIAVRLRSATARIWPQRGRASCARPA
jgi:hypothetical protein